MNTWRKWAPWLGALIHMAISLPMLSAFTLEPVILELQPSGPGAAGVFTLNNPGNKPMAVELSVLSRTQDQDGREVRSPAPAGLVTLFPSNLILEPGSRRTVRIKWTGPANIVAEQSFRVLAEQLPVDFDGTESQENSGRISIMFRYLAALYIRPENSSPKILIAPAEPGKVGVREGGFWLEVKNEGTRHRILNNLRLRLISSTGTVQVLEGDILKGLSDENLLAGSLRYFRVPGFTWTGKELPRVELEMDDL